MRNSSPETQRDSAGICSMPLAEPDTASSSLPILGFLPRHLCQPLVGRGVWFFLIGALALQAPAFPVRVSKSQGTAVHAVVLQLLIPDHWNTSFVSPCNWYLRSTHGQTRPRDVCQLARGHQLLRDWAGSGVLVSFFIKTAFVLCSGPACEGPRWDVCVLSLGHPSLSRHSSHSLSRCALRTCHIGGTVWMQT